MLPVLDWIEGSIPDKSVICICVTMNYRLLNKYGVYPMPTLPSPLPDYLLRRTFFKSI